MGTRLGTAGVALPIIVYLLQSPEWVVVLVAGAAVAGVLELLWLTNGVFAGWHVVAATASGVVPVVVWAHGCGSGWTLGCVLGAAGAGMVCGMGVVDPREGGKGVLSVVAAGVGVLYIALPLGIAGLFPTLDPAYSGLGVVVLFTAWNVDNGGLVGGNISWPWTKHRLAPVLSPKKTWEGVVCGAILASLSPSILEALADALGIAWAYPVHARFPWDLKLVLAATVTVTMVAGDLLESFLKRGVQVKDSSGLFPGHGGVLDKIDGLVFALPAAYALLYAHYSTS